MSQKRSILGRKLISEYVNHTSFSIFDVTSYILLDFKKRCQAFPSIANPILSKRAIARYSSYQVRFSLI